MYLFILSMVLSVSTPNFVQAVPSDTTSVVTTTLTEAATTTLTEADPQTVEVSEIPTEVGAYGGVCGPYHCYSDAYSKACYLARCGYDTVICKYNGYYYVKYY